MRMLSRTIFLLFGLATVGYPKLAVTFCDLLKNPQENNGKEVTVRATYRYGFEWQELYCLDCLDKGKVWLELPYDLDDASSKALKRAPKYAGIVNLTVQGVFMSGSAYGHLGGYRYQMVARRISNVTVVLKGMKKPEEEEKAERRWACGGTDPK